MTRIALVMVLALLAAGCSSARYVSGTGDVRRIEYFRDGRTSLCFARVTEKFIGYDSTDYTQVPCTEEILALIREDE